MFDWALDFLNQFWAFLGAIPALANDLLVKLSAWYVIWVTKAKISFIEFSWTVAQEIINQLNISGTINQYWSTIDSGVMGGLTYFRIPEAFNMLLNAHLTRYVMTVLK